MRDPRWKVFGLALLVALSGLRCAAPRQVPSVVKPRVVEVEGADPLLVKVTEMEKRHLRTQELASPMKEGFRWEFRVKIANPRLTGVSLDRLRLTVQNLWGRSWPGDQPLNVRVEGGSEAQVLVHGQLASSNPQDAPSLTGVETLMFLGRHDDGAPVSFTVRIPLD
ncbi:MAG: hypothetical protein ACE5IQ_06385 [Candidatus Methylomirabilales bacterium]